MPPAESVPTYRERLRVEGATLAGCGLLGSLLLLLLAPQSRRWPLNTLAQLAAVAVLLAVFGPRSVRKAIAGSVPVVAGAEGSGEPTPLWLIALIVPGLALSFAALSLLPLPAADRAGWDVSLRITGGCVLVGAAQALLLEREVARDEAATGRRHYRLPGSRIGRGTKLGFTGPPVEPPAT